MQGLALLGESCPGVVFSHEAEGCRKTTGKRDVLRGLVGAAVESDPPNAAKRQAVFAFGHYPHSLCGVSTASTVTAS